MLFDFVGIGGLSYDLVLQVDQFPQQDVKVKSRLLGRFPGGFIANATVAAATLGLKTAHIGWIGDDSEGRMLREAFEAADVDVVGLETVAGDATPFTIVMLNEQTERIILVPAFPLYKRSLTMEQLKIVKQAKIVYSEPRDRAWCSLLAANAHQNRGIFALDIEHSEHLETTELRDIIAVADVCFITKDVLKTLEADSLDDVQTGGWVVMTDGKLGAYGCARGSDTVHFQPGFPVEAVDTTGAGDCFHAALLACYLSESSIEYALKFATAAASIKIQHIGARNGLPTCEAVEAALADYK